MSLLIMLTVSTGAFLLALWLLVYKYYGDTVPCVSVPTTGMHENSDQEQQQQILHHRRPLLGFLARFCSLTQEELRGDAALFEVTSACHKTVS